MRALRIIFLTVLLLATSGSTAKASVNPATWNFSLTTYGLDNTWNSSISVVPTYPQYEYVWGLTHEAGPWPALQVVGQWFDIWNDISPGDKSGSGTFGSLPTVDTLIIHISYPEISADFYTSIDSGGYGHISIRNVDFGSADGYPVTGARFSGAVTVTGVVPEPATISLLGTAGMWVLTRKRRSLERNPANKSRLCF